MKKPRKTRSILFRREFRALSGRGHATVIYLSAILFVSFLVFGFGETALRLRRQLLADPFTNWVNLDYHSGNRDSLRALHIMISDSAFRDSFRVRGSYFYNKSMVAVITRPGAQERYEARTIDPGSSVLNRLLANGNLLAAFYPAGSAGPFASEPNGVIISRRLLADTGLPADSVSFLRIASPAGDFIPVPVLAVVAELPDRADLAFTNLFYCKWMNPGFYDRDDPRTRLLVESTDTAGVLRILDELLPALGVADPATVQTARLVTGHSRAMNWVIEIGRQQPPLQPGRVAAVLREAPSLAGRRIGPWYELSRDSACDNSAFYHDHLAIEFDDLEQLRMFGSFLRERMGLELSLEVLEGRETTLLAGRLAAGLTLLLMGLSVVAVSAYLAAVIRNHLRRIRRHLGSLLALGMPGRMLSGIYTRVVLAILGAAMAPALLLAHIAGGLAGEWVRRHTGAGEPFNLFTGWFLLFVLILALTAALRTRASVAAVVRQSPGNLVYERGG